MMSSEELSQQLTQAAGQFPVRGWPADLQRRAARRRRRNAAMTVGAAAATITAAVAIPLAATTSPTHPRQTVTSTGAEASYLGSSWRLTNVTEGSSTFAIPATFGTTPGLGTQVEFLPGGRIFVNDSVNVLEGRYTTNAHGFKVRDVTSSAVAYDGKDPRRTAAVQALDTLAEQSARNTVIEASRTQLVIQAGKFQLTLERTGPAISQP